VFFAAFVAQDEGMVEVVVGGRRMGTEDVGNDQDIVSAVPHQCIELWRGYKWVTGLLKL